MVVCNDNRGSVEQRRDLEDLARMNGDVAKTAARDFLNALDLVLIVDRKHVERFAVGVACMP